MDTIPETLRASVLSSLDEDDYEGAVEAVFAFDPTLTRDQAVDIVEEIDGDRDPRPGGLGEA